MVFERHITHLISVPFAPDALRRFFNLNTSRNIAEILGATKRAPTGVVWAEICVSEMFSSKTAAC